MSTTAWRFGGTEGADEAVLRLKQLDDQGAIDVQDAAVLRWPLHAAAPTAQEHVTEQGGAVSTLVHRMRHGTIDSAMIESVKTDIAPGTSALVLLSSDAAVDVVAKAFADLRMQLVRSDLSVQQQDRLRAMFGDAAGPGRQPDEHR